MNTTKVDPFEQENEHEKLDENFFVRMKRFEIYYENKSRNNVQFIANYKILKRINDLLNQHEMSQRNVWEIVQFFNRNSSEYSNEGSGWLDTRLHLRHLAFVYGIRLKIDEELQLVED